MIVSTRGRRGGDGVDVGQAERVLDLRLDADPADLQARGLLDLGQQQVERDDLFGRLHLGQHDGVEVGAGALDDLHDVGVGPLRRPVVDPDGADPLPQPPSLSAATMFLRASGLASGARRPRCRGRPGRRQAPGPCRSSSGWSREPRGSSGGAAGGGATTVRRTSCSFTASGRRRPSSRRRAGRRPACPPRSGVARAPGGTPTLDEPEAVRSQHLRPAPVEPGRIVIPAPFAPPWTLAHGLRVEVPGRVV